MSYPFHKIDLHMHSTVSDGTDTPEDLLEKVKASGIGVFSITDHDAVKSAQILRGVFTPNDPRFIPGVEFSCKDQYGKYHILGYGFDPDSDALQSLVSRSHLLRMQKVIARLDFLESQYGVFFPAEEITKLLSMDNPGKPHIALLLIRYGYAKTINEAITRYLDHIRLRFESIQPSEVMESILKSGGIPVLAHPIFGSGSSLIPIDEMEQRLRRLLPYGLQGIEAFYSGFTATQRTEMLFLAQKYNLYVTAGSDYHGTNKTVSLGDTGFDAASPVPDGLQRFLDIWE